MTDETTEPTVEATLDDNVNERKETENETEFAETQDASPETEQEAEEKTYTEAEVQKKLDKVLKKRLKNARSQTEQLLLEKVQELEQKVVGSNPTEGQNIDTNADIGVEVNNTAPDIQQEVAKAVVNLVTQHKQQTEAQKLAAREKAFVAHQERFAAMTDDYEEVIDEKVKPLTEKTPKLLEKACLRPDGAEILYKMAIYFPKRLEAIANDVDKLEVGEFAVLAKEVAEHEKALKSKKTNTPETITPSSAKGGAVKIGSSSSSDRYAAALNDYL